MKSTSNPAVISGKTKRRGRKAEHFRTADDGMIEGLARRPSDGRWRIIGTTITYTETDEARAVARFRHWQQQHGHAPMAVAQPFRETSTAVKELARRAKAIGSATMTVGLKTHVNVQDDDVAVQNVTVLDPSLRPEQWVWLTEQFLTRAEWVAERTGLPQLGWYRDWKKPQPSATLEEVGKLYFSHAKISENWLAKSKQFWREFTECVGVSTLRELDQDCLVRYGDMVKENGETSTYARQRFGAIKAIINFPPKRGKWAEEAKRALAFCAVLIPPKKSAMDPRPIGVDDFNSLLKSAGTEMKAILLLALNGCMYAGEVAALDWSEIDLAKGTLVTSRNKTKVVRIAVLWTQTIEALKALPRRSGVDAIFLTEAGTQSSYLIVNRAFKKFRKAVKLPTVQFSQIRDGAYTSAVEAGIDLNLCRLLAGHATGISDAYVKRRPAMVTGACEAIEKAYFG